MQEARRSLMYLTREEIDLCMQASLNEYRNKVAFIGRPCTFEYLWDEQRFDSDPRTTAHHTTEGHFGERVIGGDLTLFIVFRGSEEDELNNEDWHSNFRFKLVPGEADMVPTTSRVPVCGSVHKGFLEGYQEVKDRILAKAQHYQRIIVTGHSRGAGIAAICHENLLFRMPGKPVYLVALSCPPTGNAYFVQSSKARSAGMYHFWYGDDTVVRGFQAYAIQKMMGYEDTPVESHLDKNRWLPWNWLPKLTSWPFDHWPDTLQREMRRRMDAQGIAAKDIVTPGVHLRA